MHILKAERLGTVCCAVAVAACLGVEAWNMRIPKESHALTVVELLAALEAMAGPSHRPGFYGPEEGRSSGRDFPEAHGPIDVLALDSVGWVGLGLTPRQARSAVRYARAVGGIRSRSMLGRMRVLPSGWLAHYDAELQFPATAVRELPEEGQESRFHGSEEPSFEALSEVHPAVPVNINVADSLELIDIKGVGPWVAGRILKARKEWGGIADPSSFLIALDGWDSLADALAPRFIFNPEDVRRRCAATLSAEEWAALPGLRRREGAILRRFIAHHPHTTWAEMVHPAVDSVRWATVTHYLTRCGKE